METEKLEMLMKQAEKGEFNEEYLATEEEFVKAGDEYGAIWEGYVEFKEGTLEWEIMEKVVVAVLDEFESDFCFPKFKPEVNEIIVPEILDIYQDFYKEKPKEAQEYELGSSKNQILMKKAREGKIKKSELREEKVNRLSNLGNKVVRALADFEEEKLTWDESKEKIKSTIYKIAEIEHPGQELFLLGSLRSYQRIHGLEPGKESERIYW